ncbi:MAG: hypothetical protein WAV84_11060 [Bacteroidota bacterium]
MKKVLSLVAMFAFAMSLTTVFAQDKPKEDTRKAKTECSSEAKKGGCCDKEVAKVKKIEAKKSCGVKCQDECTSSTKTSSKKSEAK